jgi:hypothetical protein
VKVIMHNTLASSDYGLLNENTFAPRPNYWAALLWQKLMGTTVLDPHLSFEPNIYVYAQCLRNHSGGVALLVINADHQHALDVRLPVDTLRYTLTAKQVQDSTVQLNGNTLQLDRFGDLPQLRGKSAQRGSVSFGPLSITFVAAANAKNKNCF